jgi:copper oxidase (laccase) domain-containing protein
VSIVLKTSGFNLVHTQGTDSANDISFQKIVWSPEKKSRNLENAYRLCEEAGINARSNLAVVGFKNNNDDLIRLIDAPDNGDLFEKIDGNALITDTNVCLMGWASDCCLLAIVGDGGETLAVVHASVNSFSKGIIERTLEAMRERGVRRFEAYIGVCAGECCYEYGEDRAKLDFANYPDFIKPSQVDGKVFLDLYGAIIYCLERHGVEVTELSPECHCNICAKASDGRFVYPSFRRDVDENGNHVNGQYGLFICKN